MELKNKMFKLFIFVGIFCYGDCFVTYSQADKVKLKQPNIIIIMADDMGYGDFGFHNNPTIQTPFLVFNYYKGETSYFNPLLYKNGKKFQSKGYCSDVFTNET
jgi:hypothetical protein